MENIKLSRAGAGAEAEHKARTSMLEAERSSSWAGAGSAEPTRNRRRSRRRAFCRLAHPSHPGHGFALLPTARACETPHKPSSRAPRGRTLKCCTCQCSASCSWPASRPRPACRSRIGLRCGRSRRTRPPKTATTSPHGGGSLSEGPRVTSHCAEAPRAARSAAALALGAATWHRLAATARGVVRSSRHQLLRQRRCRQIHAAAGAAVVQHAQSSA